MSPCFVPMYAPMYPLHALYLLHSLCPVPHTSARYMCNACCRCTACPSALLSAVSGPILVMPGLEACLFSHLRFMGMFVTTVCGK